MSETQEFNFDDFFFNDSDLLDVEIESRGRMIPFKIKQGVSFADVRAAQKNAVKIVYKPDGSVLSVQNDEGVANLELLARVLKEWPFKQNGEPVPITRENIDLMDGNLVQELALKIKDLVQRGREALAPLEKTSGDPS